MRKAEKKIRGIKKAIGEYKSWLSLDPRHAADIMLDKSTGEVWTDSFPDCNEWKEYHSRDIVSLAQYVRERTDEPFTVQLLVKYAKEAVE